MDAQQSTDPLRPKTKDAELKQQLSQIKHKIVVLSGKGGVGKSTVAANLAVALALQGKQVGLLDIDFHGPSIPKLMGLEDVSLKILDGIIAPAVYRENLKVMSIGFVLQNKDDAVIWRGPLKIGVIKQFLSEVAWGVLDYLVIDSPSGTGDEPLTMFQILGESSQAVIVTTPQAISLNDVRKSITFCRKLKVLILGVIENMSGFICPHCSKSVDIFKTGGGRRMAEEMGVPFLGQIPIDPQIVESGDNGQPYVDIFAQSAVAKIFLQTIQPILTL